MTVTEPQLPAGSRPVPVARGDHRIPGLASGHRRHAGGQPAGGRHPAAARPGPFRPYRLRGVPQGGGREPDRFVQGPGHDGGDQHGGGHRRQGGDLRVDRQHQRECRRLRGPGRAHLRGAGAARQDRHRQARAGAGARSAAASGGRLVRRLPRAGQEAGRRVSGGPGQLGEPGSDPGPEDAPRSRSWTNSATRPTCTASRSGTRGISPRTGWAIPSTSGQAWRPARRGCSGSRPAERRRS